MDKKTLKAKHESGILPTVGVLTISNTLAIEVITFEYGITDYILGCYGSNENKTYFRVKLYDAYENTYFKIGKAKYLLSDVMRVA